MARTSVAGLATAIAIQLVVPVFPIFSREASAAPTQGDTASAKAALKEGRELREKGDVPGALTKFKAAYALVPTVITGWELGKTYEMLGQLLEARDTLLEVIAIPVSPKEIDEHKAARANADELAQKIKPRIPSVSITVSGNVVEGVTKVSIDGREVPLASLGAARKLNPGKHSIKASTGAEEKVEELTLKEGESKPLTLVIPEGKPGEKPTPIVPPGGPGKPSDKDTSPGDSGGGRRTLGYVSLAVGGVFVAGAVVSFVLSGKAADDLQTFREANCFRTCADDDKVSAVRRWETITFVSGGLALAAVGVGVTLLVTAPSSESKPSVALGAGPGSLVLWGRF